MLQASVKALRGAQFACDAGRMFQLLEDVRPLAAGQITVALTGDVSLLLIRAYGTCTNGLERTHRVQTYAKAKRNSTQRNSLDMSCIVFFLEKQFLPMHSGADDTTEN